MTMKQPIALATFAAIALSATALAQTPQAPAPVVPTLPGQQTPALGQPTVNCPDGTIRAVQDSQAAGALSAGKPSAAGAASALGAAPAVKPNIGTAGAIAGTIPATKPYAAAMTGAAPQTALPSTQSTTAADPCAPADQLKSLVPKR